MEGMGIQGSAWMGEGGRGLHEAQPRQGLPVLIVDYNSKILLIKIVSSSEAVRRIPIYLFSHELGKFPLNTF